MIRRYVGACSSVLLVAMLLLGITVQLSATGAPEETTFVWSNHTGGSGTPEESQKWIDEISKESGLGIKIKLIHPTDEESVMKISSMLAAGEQLDLCYLDWDRYDVVVADNPNIFQPLDDYIKKSKIFSDTAKFPARFWEQMKKPDGHIYAVRLDNNWGQGGTLPTVRWDWVVKLGLAAKYENNQKLTLDDYYQLIRAFTLNDPDGNGQNDTYGLALGSTLYETQPFFGTVGAIRLFAKDAAGKVYVPYAQDKTKPVWEFLRRLYAEKLLEPNFVTNSSSNFQSLFLTDKVGLICYWANSIHNKNAQVKKEKPSSTFFARPLWPPVGPDGTALLRTGAPRIDGIPVTSKLKDKAFQLLEFFNTDKGAILCTGGIEGYNYTVQNGKYTIIPGRGGPGGVTPGWAWEPPWDVPSEWLEALRICAKWVHTQETYGRSGDQWEEVTGIDGARIIRGEVSIEEGLASMRKRLLDLKLVDY
jgi:putative aldouronate transport system substrate-binding protein